MECSSGIHFIHGKNAQGKTTILEAIYLLSNLRSFRDHDVSSLLQSGQEHGQVKGSFLIDSDTHAELKVELVRLNVGQQKVQKRAYINQKLARSSADYFGVKLHHSPIQFHAINLNPTSTDLIRGEPALRRNYLNQVIASESPQYLNVLKRYQKALDHKNALLKQEHGFDSKILSILNETLAKEGSEILLQRLKYLSEIYLPLESFLSKFAPDQTPPVLGYFSRVFEGTFESKRGSQHLYFTGHFELPPLNFLVELYHRQFTLLMVQEKARRTSLVGPHRDDFIFKIGNPEDTAGKELVDVGSQGEVRSFLLALKLAELEHFQSQTQVRPVLLIDDFSSELDKSRRHFLLDYLKDSQLQIFVTSTDDLSNFKSGNSGSVKAFNVLNGNISEE